MLNKIFFFLLVILCCGCNSEKTIYKDVLNSSENWIVEQQPKGISTFTNNTLEVIDAKGCTIWFKNKLKGNIKIQYDITIIDKAPEQIHKLAEKLDVRTFIGNAGHPNILLRAGAEEADMLIAVTNSDETNMIACQIAHTLFQTPKKIARIRSLQYLAYDNLFDIHSIPVDVVISPEQLVADHVRRLIIYPSAIQVFDFANQTVQLILVKTLKNGSLTGKPLSQLQENLPSNASAKVSAIYRKTKTQHPTPKHNAFWISPLKTSGIIKTYLRGLVMQKMQFVT